VIFINRKTRTKNKGKTRRIGKELNILYANANGIYGKTESIKTALEEQGTHIAFITETKLEHNPPHVAGYNWITRNRQCSKGGGVAVIYNENLKNNIQTMDEYQESNCGIVWVELRSGQAKTYFGIYYGPQKNVNKEMVEEQMSTIRTHMLQLQQKGM
jgi:exonuclease III